MAGTLGELGSWKTELVADTPVVLWRPAWERRDRKIPLSVVIWAAEEIPGRLKQLTQA